MPVIPTPCLKRIASLPSLVLRDNLHYKRHVRFPMAASDMGLGAKS